MRLDLVIDTPHPPDRFIAALTDFSERRPDHWPFLARGSYEVHELGETEAEVTEGTTSPAGAYWARERYDWSKPGVVSWTVRDSNFCEPGTTIVARVSPRGEGSRIDLSWERRPKGWRGALFMAMMKPFGKAFLRRAYAGVRL